MSSLSYAGSASPLPLLIQRETGFFKDLGSRLFPCRLAAAKNMYRRDLYCHYGCVNAIEFSDNGEYLVSGGDDRRVMLWKFGETVVQQGKPQLMSGQHQSNIFCLGITSDNCRIYSGGNDNLVVVHDMETGRAIELLEHQRAVCGIGVHPQNPLTLATAGNDGRLLYFDTRHSDEESMVIARSRKAFHAVMFHPTQTNMVASANLRDGIALWDLRANKQPVMRYIGHNGYTQNGMSVRFSRSGARLVALRRRHPPVLYSTEQPYPIAEFQHNDYHNSCTMKSCSFAGSDDEYVLSGSDDFNLYMWKVPEGGGLDEPPASPPRQVPAHVVLHGHRSIVNQVRYNRRLGLVASSGVEKIIKIWSTLEYPGMSGALLEETSGPDTPREVYSHEDYVSLVHHGGQYIAHNYDDRSTSEDPRMMAFFDSLVQREAEGLAESASNTESDGDSNATCRPTSDSDDSDQIVLAYSCVQKRSAVLNGRNQRCMRVPRRLPARHSKHVTSQARGSIIRRSKQARGVLARPVAGSAGPSGKGKRVTWRSGRAVRLPPPAPRRSAPSSERTDSDEPEHSLYRHTGKIIRPLRRRMNLSRTLQRKVNTSNFRKLDLQTTDNITLNSSTTVENGDDEELLTLPSTSSGYRGQNSCLFRIAEVDSDDDQTKATTSGIQNNTHTPNLVSSVPTPINGSQDSLPTGDSMRSIPESTSNPSSPTPGARAWAPKRSSRRAMRSGAAMRRSDSSESPTPMEQNALYSERLSYSPIVRLLLDETNESEMESSCSTSAHSCTSPRNGPVVNATVPEARGSNLPEGGVAEDPQFALLKIRQRVKRARRNYRSNTGESDSN